MSLGYIAKCALKITDIVKCSEKLCKVNCQNTFSMHRHYAGFQPVGGYKYINSPYTKPIKQAIHGYFNVNFGQK